MSLPPVGSAEPLSSGAVLVDCSWVSASGPSGGVVAGTVFCCPVVASFAAPVSFVVPVVPQAARERSRIRESRNPIHLLFPSTISF
ncbi:MAG: hypothetical protein II038_00430 [Lachnospiraceae bacterium]|nr:hypothetical protein [Lachnospiraceae bacterium]